MPLCSNTTNNFSRHEMSSISSHHIAPPPSTKKQISDHKAIELCVLDIMCGCPKNSIFCRWWRGGTQFYYSQSFHIQIWNTRNSCHNSILTSDGASNRLVFLLELSTQKWTWKTNKRCKWWWDMYFSHIFVCSLFCFSYSELC